MGDDGGYAPETLSAALVAACCDLGVTCAYGLVGGALAPFYAAICASRLRVVQTRHEGGAAFAATEHSVASGAPALVFCTTGPGLTNALTGIYAARSEGAKLVVVSGATSAPQRGRMAVQETSDIVFPAGVSPSAFDFVVTLEHPSQLSAVTNRLAALSRRGPFVALIQVPVAVQRLPGVDARVRHVFPADPTPPTAAALKAAVAALSVPFVVCAGFGARRFAPQLRRFLQATDAPVFCTPRGKGAADETMSRYLGVSGFGGHDSVERCLAQSDAPLLVLGSQLGEFSTIWDQRIAARTLVHVDHNALAFGVGFPSARTIPIEADIGAFLDAITPLLGKLPPTQDVQVFPPAASPKRTDHVRPSVLMAALQTAAVDGGAVDICAEPGSAFAWTNHYLKFNTPRYRISGAWASMGHMTTGALGTHVATGRPCIVVTGDGSMLMSCELSTAAAIGAHVIWIVLNDARLSITHAGLIALGYAPAHTTFPRCDFAAIARACGCEGVSVCSEFDVAGQIAAAITSGRPTVIDVRIDADEVAPFSRRNTALAAMGAQRADLVEGVAAAVGGSGLNARISEEEC